MNRDEAQEGSAPGFWPPPRACDAHCHIVGPQARFALAPERRTSGAEDASKDMLASMHEQIGVERAVIVHSALHGTDLSATLDALAAEPTSRRRAHGSVNIRLRAGAFARGGDPRRSS